MWIVLQEIACLLKLNSEEHGPVSVSSQDAETQSDPKILFDAEIQCQTILTRSIAIQTLAQRKTKSKNQETPMTPGTNHNINNSCPVVTPPSTPTETEGQKTSTSHNINNNCPVVTPPSTPVVIKETNTSITTSDSEQAVHDDYSSSSDDEKSDSDDDFVSSELDTSDESEGEDLKNERKFIVFESMLDQLFISCKTCGSLCEIEKFNTGSMVTIKATCCNNHTFQWRSQPELHNKPAGNILIPAATVITGGTYESTKQFANALNLNFVNKDQFYNVQDKIVFPVINNVYEKQRKDVTETIKKEDTPVNLCGDGRSDSPGHNAKYGTYSLMDETSGKIVDFSLVHVSEVSSSNAMENEGCQRSLNKVINQNVKIRSLTTDRHTQITSEMRKKYPSIIHQYDVWHLSKWVTKKLTKKAKKKANELLLKWVQSVSNHLWWCAQTCDGDSEVLHEKWVSILHHVVNKHSWKNGKHFPRCEHSRLPRNKERKTKWLEAGSAAHIALEEVVLNKKLVKDISKLTEFHHTGNLEVYHSLLLKYAPKRQHFSYKGMVARTQLAVIDHNSNTGRKQATVMNGNKQGAKRYKVVFPKGRKKWVAKPVLARKSFSFVQNLMEDVFSFKDDKSQNMSTMPANIPKNIAPTPRPIKYEVITAHRSRMGKKS